MQLAEERNPGDRADRDRRIIQETAALLSADYPLDKLIERLCDTLAVTLGASVAYVALPGNDRTVRLSYFNDHGKKKRPVDFVIPRGSHTHNVFVTGRSILKRHEEDWAASQRYALNPDHPETDDSVSSIWVPIKYADEVLGVLSVQSTAADSYDAEDVKLLEAVARYLAIAIRNQRSLRMATRPFRGMQRTFAALAGVALLLTLAILASYIVRTRQIENDALAAQTARANHVSDGLVRYLLDADQLASTSASLVATLHDQRSEVERELRSVARSASSTAIYGAGAWFEPFKFAPALHYFGPYVHRKSPARSDVVLTYEWNTQKYNYPAQPWYTSGKAAGGRVIFTEPYFDTDYVYMSAVKAFRDSRGKVLGVVSVDMVVASLRDYIASQSQMPNTIVYVLTGKDRVFVFPQQATLFAFARGRGLHPKSVLDIPPSIVRLAIAQTYGANRSEV
ncbi:MAG: GAF domain-containing protein, partial [Candidatus Eremiobacteraeota bacterium]|nr:GAF domain-containing protein [Candidatus Eremiobacteraeota bacterium]